jgi:hypothetical protein
MHIGYLSYLFAIRHVAGQASQCDFCGGQRIIGRTWVSSVSIAPLLLRALASGTANIMQFWELTALLNDNLTSQKRRLDTQKMIMRK